MIDLETLERRQAERIQHFRALEALIEQKQREIENINAAPVITPEPTVPRLAVVR